MCMDSGEASDRTCLILPWDMTKTYFACEASKRSCVEMMSPRPPRFNARDPARTGLRRCFFFRLRHGITGTERFLALLGRHRSCGECLGALHGGYPKEKNSVKS